MQPADNGAQEGTVDDREETELCLEARRTGEELVMEAPTSVCGYTVAMQFQRPSTALGAGVEDLGTRVGASGGRE